MEALQAAGNLLQGRVSPSPASPLTPPPSPLPRIEAFLSAWQASLENQQAMLGECQALAYGAKRQAWRLSELLD